MPSPIKSTPPSNAAQTYKKYNQDQFSELIESSLTVRENEEFLISCVVENSKPVADVRFVMSSSSSSLSANDAPASQLLTLNNNDQSSYLTLPPLSLTTKIQHDSPSIVSVNTNVVRNVDQTYKTVLTVRIRPTQDDHGKTIACKADNGFSNQKWENKKVLNVLCKHSFFSVILNTHNKCSK